MKDNKLMSMSDFVLYKDSLFGDHSTKEFSYVYYRSFIDYANFLKQLIELRMLVPCDSKGNILEYPEKQSFYQRKDSTQSWGDFHAKQYHEAKVRVLFEGFTWDEENHLMYKGDYKWDWGRFKTEGKDYLSYDIYGRQGEMFHTIEDLVKNTFTLTPTAMKQFK